MITEILTFTSTIISIYALNRVLKLEKKLKKTKHHRNNYNSEDSSSDELLEEAIRLVTSYEKASTSLLQRKFKIGYNRAERIIDELFDAGVVSEADGKKPRNVLIKNANEYIGSWKQKNK